MFIVKYSNIFNISPIRFFTTTNRLKTIKLSDRYKYPFLTKSSTVTENSGSYNILLDNKLLLTPLGNIISTNNLKLANLIRDEFEVKINQVGSFNDFPYTMLLSKSLDITNESKLDNIKKLKESINTDTILFFEKVDLPPNIKNEIPNLDILTDNKLDSLRNFDLELVQTYFYTPVLHTFSQFFNLPSLNISNNVSKTPIQHQNTISFINSFIDNLNIFQLISTVNAHSSSKSLILTLLYLHEVLTINNVLRISRIEETIQSSHWGVTDTFDLEEALILKQLETSLVFYKINS